MAADTKLFFFGRRWPAAYAVTTGPNRGRTIYSASGKGQAWTTDRSLAFWRSFSELDPSDRIINTLAEKRAEKFLSRYGDPTGQMDHGATAGTRIVSDALSWRPLIDALRHVAAAWEQPNARGVSHWSGDHLRTEVADKALRNLLPADVNEDRQISKEIDVLFVRGLSLQPQTLRAFMVISAASARERRIKMRKCAHCTDWFELRRSDASYCSPSCQAISHKQRTVATRKRVKRKK